MRKQIMKRIWILLFAVTSILFVFSSCNTEITDDEESAQSAIEDNVDASSAHEHTPVVDSAVAATCKNTGLTEGTHCSVCNEVLIKQDVVPITDEHTPVVDSAVAATCKNTGLTEGSHCSVCNKVLVKQEVVPATDGHVFVLHNVNYKCSSCGLEVLEHGNADGSIAGGNNQVKYYVTGKFVHQDDFDYYTDYEIVIYGSGDMPDFSKTNQPMWHDYLREAKKITIKSGITSIGKYAFYLNDTVVNACDFVMSDTVKTIKSYAINLKINKLDLSSNIETIQADALAAYKINFIYIPKSLKKMCSSILLNTTCVYEGTLEEFYQIKVEVYPTDKTVKDYIGTFEDWFLSNIHIYTQATSISDLSQYWK